MIDILIIGSGPAGLSAAIYAHRANCKVLVIEKEYEGTGQIVESSQVDNYPGLLGKTGYELGELFREHASLLGIDFYEGEVIKIEETEDGWRAILDHQKEIKAKTVIYCGGTLHRHLNIPGEKELLGKGISFCAICDGAFYKEKETVVIGGGNTALDEALYLSEICKKVTLIHRRDEFRGAAQTLKRLKEKENIEILTNVNTEQIIGTNKVEAILLSNGKNIKTDGIFIAVGMIPNTEIVKGIVELDEQGYILATETGITKAKGFFAAGDVRQKKLRQVVTAVSDGANAAMEAVGFLTEQELIK